MEKQNRKIRWGRVLAGVVAVALGLGMTACQTAEPDPPRWTPGSSGPYGVQKDLAVQALVGRLEESRDGLYVYRDFSDQVNCYTQRAKIRDGLVEVRDMDENWITDPYAGSSCIRCEVSATFGGWGGWLFLTGVLEEGSTVPRLNRGDAPGEGLDLTGAKSLVFYARGETGNEAVEFFTCGFGYDGGHNGRQVKYPDSARKRSLGTVRLTTEWRAYEIPLWGGEPPGYLLRLRLQVFQRVSRVLSG